MRETKREGEDRQREGTGRGAAETGAQNEVGLHCDGRVAGNVHVCNTLHECGTGACVTVQVGIQN